LSFFLNFIASFFFSQKKVERNIIVNVLPSSYVLTKPEFSEQILI